MDNVENKTAKETPRIEPTLSVLENDDLQKYKFKYLFITIPNHCIYYYAENPKYACFP